jgi:predicted nucleic acid-binding protein
MARLVFLDSGPLWLAASPRGKPRADDCRIWLSALRASGTRVFVPEIADYETRRETLLRGATANLRRLDGLKATLDFLPINSPALLRAAQLWARVRRQGKPTAGPQDFDVDCIVAGQALTAAGPSDTIVIATNNVSHLSLFPGI